MANRAVERIQKEFKQGIGREQMGPCSIKLELVNGNWTELRGEIAGPPDTPYEGGRFILDIKVPETYPFRPPKVRFLTRIWHPNICSVTGAICQNSLKDNWSPMITLPSLLISLQAWLSDAEPDDPMDKVVALQFKEQYDVFLLTAKHWTNAYAGGPHAFPECDSKIQRLRDLNMGVDEHYARLILSKENWVLLNAFHSPVCHDGCVALVVAAKSLCNRSQLSCEDLLACSFNDLY